MKSPKNTTENRSFFSILLPLVIFVMSCILIFYQFSLIPKKTTFDEVEFAKLAILLQKQPPAPYSSYATGHATLYFYIISFLFALLSPSLFSLRLTSAVCGVINPLLLYFIFTFIFSKNTKSSSFVLFRISDFGFRISSFLPFLLSLVFLSMRWYFNFARFGFEVTFLLCLELTSLLWMFRYFENKKNRYLILAGVFAGLAYNSYQPGRMFVLVPLFLFFLKSFRFPLKSYIGQNKKNLMLFLIPFFVIILPLVIYLQIHKDIRFYQQFYPDNHEMTLSQKNEYFVRNLQSTLGIFLVRGDVNGRHNYPNKPALNPILGVFFLGGLIIACIKWKDNINAVFLLWFLISLIPTLVTYPWENPNMLRTFTVIPSVVYFIGLSISNLLLFFEKQKTRQIAVMIGLCILFAFSSFYEIRTYFVHQVPVFENAFEAEHSLNYYLTH